MITNGFRIREGDYAVLGELLEHRVKHIKTVHFIMLTNKQDRKRLTIFVDLIFMFERERADVSAHELLRFREQADRFHASKIFHLIRLLARSVHVTRQAKEERFPVFIPIRFKKDETVSESVTAKGSRVALVDLRCQAGSIHIVYFSPIIKEIFLQGL